MRVAGFEPRDDETLVSFLIAAVRHGGSIR
jgi:hypothetical protein